MKISLFVVGVVSAAVLAETPSLSFEAWAQRFNKTYASQVEEDLARHHFDATVRRVDELNAGHNETRFALNQFSDWSLEAFHKYADCHKPSVKNTRIPIAFNSVAPPDEWDWRDKGAVTAVKNQGNCGSCWSFATTGMTEGANFLINKNLTSLSEQDLVDCATGDSYPNDGCDGGRADWGSEYIKRNGVDTEAEYPYKAANGQCHQQSPAAAYLQSYSTLPKDEDQLKAAVYQFGPVAVAIDVTDTFANYHSGVFVDSTCKNGDFDVNHAVLVVGYGTSSSDGSDYWIVKNSWGASWGNNGYVLMRRNYNNMCGIVTDAVYGVGKKL